MKYLILTLIFFLENISSILIKNGFAKIKLNVTDTYNINNNECREVKIPNNYKKLILNIRSNNLDRVLITDQKIEKCSDPLSLASCCTRNSTFCIENLNPTKNDFNLNYCIDYTEIIIHFKLFFYFLCSTALTSTRWVRSTIIKLLFAISTRSKQCEQSIKSATSVKKLRNQDSNPGRLGVKLKRYHSAMPTPLFRIILLKSYVVHRKG